MDFLVEFVSDKNFFFIRFLKLFKKNIYFLKFDPRVKNEKKLASKLHSLGAKPLPVADLKDIPYSEYSNKDMDPKNLLTKKTNSLNSKKISKIFLKNVSAKSEKIVTLIIKDTISKKFTELNSYIDIWLKRKKSLILITFTIRDLILIKRSKNLTIIYLPLDFIEYILKLLFQIKFIFKQISFKFLSIFHKPKKTKNTAVYEYTVAYILHRETYYGGSGENSSLYNKSLYYSNKYEDFKKENVMHYGYELKELKNKTLKYKYLSDKHLTLKDMRLTIFFVLRSILSIRKFTDLFLISVLAINLKYYFNCRRIFEQNPKLKVAIIDYDFLCPKIITLALMSLNIKTACVQERFIAAFFKCINVFIDDYFTPSKKMNEILKSNKLNIIKNFIPVGQYRSNLISKKIKKNNSKNTIVALGFHTSHTIYDSQMQMLTNWNASKFFLEEMYRLSLDINNCKIIIRLKDFEGYKNPFFRNILEKIRRRRNIEIDSNNETQYSYKICSKADLVIARHTSLADECISQNIPVIFHDYTHNLQGNIRAAFDYDNSSLICKNYSEVLNNTKKFLSFKNNDLKKKFQNIRKKYYYYDKKITVKDKILTHLSNYLISQKN